MDGVATQRLGSKDRRRNKAFDETHVALIDAAVRLISEKGIDALSLSEVARETGVNRTTVYYHFDSRDALVSAVREWSAGQLAAAFQPVGSPADRIRYIVRFVLEHPEVTGMWIEEFLATGDITESYPDWAELVKDLGEQLGGRAETAAVDPEVYCALLLAWVMIGPRVYSNSVRPDLSIDEVVDRIVRTQLKMLQLHGIVMD